ncbi:SPOR domain-containing protein [Pseudooceanicola onchidii]|uniref:SPOR domain-containing protein n=1 Tax=Pseudooceanicola onchidii TaxID=2562279 RepID=UPI00145B7177|nr:SPOR domain-containing protein [Pseudooceanicola onchidii]
MNPLSRKFSAVLLLSILGAAPVAAQNIIRPKDGPAEYPPASFTGKQYVDSEGCVFIRAGFEGQVTWVPRVARNRSQVCGFQPTNVAGATRAQPALPRSDVTEITAAVPESGAPAETAPARVASVAAAPAAAPVVAARPQVITPAPAPVAASVAGPTVRVARPAAPVVRVPTAPVVEARPRVAAPVQTAPRAVTSVDDPCGDLSPVGRQYMERGNGGFALRCGPQSDYAPYAAGSARVVAAAPRVIAPSYAAPAPAAVALPSYEKRAPVVVAAPAPVQARTTDRPVTRVVRARTTGQGYVSPQARVMPAPAYKERVMAQDVRIPKGYRPIWEDDRLNPRRAEQTLAGKRQMELVWTKTLPRRLVPVEIRPQGVAVAPNVSSRSAAPKVDRAPISGRYVQVGSFRTPSNAQATAQRLAAAGLPVTIRNDASGQVVMAGPFGSDRAIGHALRTAQKAGFPGAFPRR